jgi:hypothetical protein
MQYVHNAKQRMPVFIDQENYKDWLNPELKKDEVMDLCRPYDDPNMRAYTISKLLTTRGINPNVPEVLQPFNYNTAIQEANEFLKTRRKKEGNGSLQEYDQSGDKMKEEHLQLAAGQEIREELVMP